MSDAYDRLIEVRIARIEAEQDKHDARITKLEFWRNTVLGFLGGAMFAAGYFAKPFADAIKHALPSLS